MNRLKIVIVFVHISIYSFCQCDIEKTNGEINTDLRTNNTRFLGDTLAAFAGSGIDGRHYTNDSLQNKITFISFWFSSCIPCINEFSDLKRMYEKYQSNLHFQFLSFTFDPVELTKKTIKIYSLPYIIITLRDEQCTELNLGKGYPTNMITDKSGRIVNISTGREIYGEENYFANKIYPLLDSLLLSNK